MNIYIYIHMYIISIYEDRSLLYQELSYDEPSFGGDAESSPPSNTNSPGFFVSIGSILLGFCVTNRKGLPELGIIRVMHPIQTRIKD